MNTDVNAAGQSPAVYDSRGGSESLCTSLTAGVLPEVPVSSAEKNSHTGVSTRYAPIRNTETESPAISPQPIPLHLQQHWYALRATYGSERKAYDYLRSKGIKVFYPTITTRKSVGSRKTKVEESRIPNIFFAHDSYDVLKEYVFDNVHDETRHLRFYYDCHHDGTKEPLIVPDYQMRSLMLICGVRAEGILLEPFVVEKFLRGQRVLVKEGPFAGAEGVVARFRGQQRVGIVIEGVMTVLTAYVPSAFLERLDEIE